MKPFTRRVALLAAAGLCAGLLPPGRAVAAGCPKPDFQAARTFTAGDSSWATVAADFNADGSKDLAFANAGSNNVSVLIGGGDGSFQPVVNYTVGLAPLSIAAGDFNMDGSLDLLSGNSNSGNLSMLLGNGNGTFQAAVSITGFGTPYSIVVGEFNGDGKPDFAYANLGSAVTVRLGNGDGTFQAGIGYAITVGGNAVAIAIGDFNGDAKSDFVVSLSAAPNAVWIMLGNGNGTFQAGVGHPSATVPWALTVGDFNGDLHDDVAVTDNVTASAKVWIHLGNGNGTLQAATGYAVGLSPDTITTADLDADGSLDLAVGVIGLPGAVFTLRGNGDGSFQASVEVRRITPVTGVTTADFNGDGTTDLAFANNQHFGANAAILVGNGDGTFQDDLFYPAGTYPQNVATADFNNDGKLDMVVANGQSTTATVRLGNGNGTFLAKNDYPVGTSPWSVATDDFNADGKADFATANFSSFDVSVRLGNGNGTFQAVVNYPTTFGALSIVAGDFDKDGKTDLVTLSLIGVYFLKGAGNGTFQAPVNSGTWSGAGNLSAGDFNGDQKLDLAVAVSSTTVDKVSVILGNGSGGFASNTDYPVGINPQGTAIGDFNGDGKKDLAVVNYGCRTNCGSVPSSSTVSVLLGNGNGTMQAAVNYPAGPFSNFIRAGDLNRDGRDDLAIVNLLPWTVSVLLSNANGSLQAGQGFGAQHGPNSVAFGDIDANGGLDMLVTNGTSNDVSIMMNSCATGSGGGSQADLSLTCTDSPDPASIGSSLTYTLGITNNGPSSATNVLATTTLPASVSFSSATAGCVEAGGTVTCNAGSLGIGANTTLMIVVTPNLAAGISASADVTADQTDPVSANNSATAGTTVLGPSCADLTGTYVSVTPKCKDKKGVTTCTIKATMSVQNLGNVTSATSVARFYLSTDAVLDTPGDAVLDDVSVKAVKTTKEGKAKLKASLAPGVLTAGQFVIAVFDAAGTIAECNEGNNTAVYGPLP